MAQLKARLWTRRDLPYAGKLTILLETEDEKTLMRLFKNHAGIKQTGARLDIVYGWPKDELDAKRKENVSGDAGEDELP